MALAGAIIGATLSFFLDPQLGRRRRALARDQAGRRFRTALRRSARPGRIVTAHGRRYRARLFRNCVRAKR
jgi:uncharacterized membrane protein YdjX (TVP38/TMEM64 family)